MSWTACISPTRWRAAATTTRRTARCCRKEVDGLLVAGRHYSATEAAQKMSREIPPCMSMGQSAGVAAALAAARQHPGRSASTPPPSAPACAPRAAIPAMFRPPMPPPWRTPRDRACRTARSPGIKIVDFTQVMMGPVATQVLADFGADVIKVERPPTGDLSRTSFPNDPAGLTGPVFARSTATSARSCSTCASRRTRTRCCKLLDQADVVVNNFRAGVMERMGFGYEELQRAQPAPHLRRGHRLRPDRPLCAQGRAGRAGAGDVRRDGAALRRRACRCRSTRPPSPTTPPACTWCRASCSRCCSARRPGAASASASRCSIPCSRRRRRRPPPFMMRGREVNWGAMPLTGVFETIGRRPRHGRRVQGQSAAGHRHGARAARRCTTIRASPTHALQVQNKPALHAIFRERFATGITTAYWLARLEEQDLLCAPVRTLGEALEDEQTAINGMILETHNRDRDGPRRRLAGASRGRAGHRPHSARRTRPAHRRGHGRAGTVETADKVA